MRGLVHALVDPRSDGANRVYDPSFGCARRALEPRSCRLADACDSVQIDADGEIEIETGEFGAEEEVAADRQLAAMDADVGGHIDANGSCRIQGRRTGG